MNIDPPQEAAAPRSRRRIWRFSLRTLLIGLTLFCVWLGMWANSANRQRRAVEAIELSGGRFNYDYQRVPTPSGRSGQRFSYKVQPPGPKWLRKIVGDHYFITPVTLLIGEQPGIKDDCLKHLDALPSLESAMFYNVPITDRDSSHFRHPTNLRFLTFNEETLSGESAPRQFDFLQYLPKLESLSLIDSRFGDSDARFLKRTVDLNTLFLYDSAIGDEGLAQLQHLKKLEMIGLGGTRVTDAGIARLTPLPKLRYASLNNLNLTDAAIEAFSKMSSLRDLELHNTKMTREGLSKLRTLLPKCEINGLGGDGSTKQESLFE